MDRLKKVIIIGAGIIGLIFAKELSALNINCEIYESKPNVYKNADKASGILSKNGLEKLGIDFSSSIENKINGAIIHINNKKIRLEKTSTVAYIINRQKIVKVLYNELRNNKFIKFNFNKKIEKQELKKLKNNKNNIIVGADGAVSAVASAFDFPKIKEYILTYKTEYNNAKAANTNFVELFFNNKLMPGFFAWVAPHSNSKIEIGIGISSNKKKNSRDIFNKFIEDKNIKQIIKNAKIKSQHASIIPIAIRKKTVIDNAILIGDAAGQVKSSTGGGIIFGAMCAKIAAEIVHQNILENKPLKKYEKEWRKKYEFDLKMHRLLHNFYSRTNNKHLISILDFLKLLNMERIISKYGDMDSLVQTLKNIVTRKKQR